MLSEREQKLRLSLYNEGLNDHQMGKRLFLTPKAVASWRRKQGLPANFTWLGPLTPEEDKRRRDAVASGMNDREVAEMFHLHPGTVTNWRKKHGIPANGKRRNYEEP